MPPEKIESRESTQRQSKILLHFLQHGEKDIGKDENKIHLTPHGRQEAKVKAVPTNIRQAIAFGSPRERSQESAALMMAGAEDFIDGNETFEELKAKLDQNLKYGSKVSSDQRLNFTMDEKTPLGALERDVYKKGGWLTFLVNESDKKAIELGDKDTSTYSRMASSVAELVKKYIGMSLAWHTLVNDTDKNYDSKLERFLGSHRGVTESFLAKIIEKTKGVEERNKFMAVLDNQGFDALEGFEIEIETSDRSNSPQLKVSYKRVDNDGKKLFAFEEYIPLSVVEEIIDENI